MAYEKQNWKTGDIITSAKLNHMEDGIAGETLVIGGFHYGDNLSSFTGTSDKTWQEIHDALEAGYRVYALITDYQNGVMQARVFATSINADETEYRIEADMFQSLPACHSADGYPTL